MQITVYITGFLYTPLILVYNERNSLRNIRSNVSIIVSDKEIIIDNQFTTITNSLARGQPFTPDNRDDLVNVSYHSVLLKTMLTTVDDLLDTLTKSIYCGIFGPILFFFYIYVVQEPLLTVILGVYHFILVLIMALITAYPLTYYLGRGVVGILRIRDIEREVNKLEMIQNFNDLMDYFDDNPVFS